MKSVPWKNVLYWLLRLSLGGLFALAGVLKLSEPSAFAIEIHNYQLLPSLSPLLAVTLPTIELTLAAALLFGPRSWVRAGALAATALLVVFTFAVASVVARGVNITCGCFGEGSGPVTMLTVLRDIALVAMSLGLYVLAGHPSEPSEGPTPKAAAAL